MGGLEGLSVTVRFHSPIVCSNAVQHSTQTVSRRSWKARTHGTQRNSVMNVQFTAGNKGLVAPRDYKSWEGILISIDRNSLCY